MSKLAEDRAFVADGAIDDLLQHAAQIPERAKRSEAEKALNNVKNDLAVVAAEMKNVAMGDSEAAIRTAAKTRAAEEPPVNADEDSPPLSPNRSAIRGDTQAGPRSPGHEPPTESG